MNTDWAKVVVNDFWSWTGTVIAIVVSFYLMIMAGKKLPEGCGWFIAMVLGADIGLKLVS